MRRSNLNLYQYVLDPSASELRDALHRSVVETVLIGTRSLDRNAVRHEIERSLGFKLDRSIVDNTIDQLVEDGTIIQEKSSGRYYSSNSRRKQLVQMQAERAKELEILEKNLVKTFRKFMKKSTKSKVN